MYYTFSDGAANACHTILATSNNYYIITAHCSKGQSSFFFVGTLYLNSIDILAFKNQYDCFGATPGEYAP
jgi:hypothetical protein